MSLARKLVELVPQANITAFQLAGRLLESRPCSCEVSMCKIALPRHDFSDPSMVLLASAWPACVKPEATRDVRRPHSLHWRHEVRESGAAQQKPKRSDRPTRGHQCSLSAGHMSLPDKS